MKQQFWHQLIPVCYSYCHAFVSCKLNLYVPSIAKSGSANIFQPFNRKFILYKLWNQLCVEAWDTNPEIARPLQMFAKHETQIQIISLQHVDDMIEPIISSAARFPKLTPWCDNEGSKPSLTQMFERLLLRLPLMIMNEAFVFVVSHR